MRLIGVWVRMAVVTAAMGLLLGGLPASGAAGLGAGRPAAPRADGLHDWPMWGYDTARTGFNPTETILTPSTVPNLHLLWTFPFALQSDNAPVFASGVDVDGTPTDLVYAGDRSGTFYAIDAATGTEVWSRNLGTHAACPGILGVTDTAVIDRSRNVLFVVGGNGKLYALELGTGQTSAGWPLSVVQFANEYVWSAVNMFDDQLYISISSGCDSAGTYYGRIVRVDPETVTQTAVFYVTDGPTTGVSGGSIWGWGGVSVDPSNGDVYAATGNGFPQEQFEHYLYSEAIVRTTGDLSLVSYHYPGLEGFDVDFGSTPVLFQARRMCGPQLVAENKSGEIFLYNRNDIAAGPADRITTSSRPLIGVAAYDPVHKLVLMGNRADSLDGKYKRGLIAFHISKSCTLHRAWQKKLSPGSFPAAPVTAGGVIYFAGSSQLSALDAATHATIWDSGTTFTSAAQTEPVVVNGHVYLTTGSGLYAFGL
jgi:outer membrane protein assembly factor BamB